MLDDYYDERGWTRELGIPTPEALEGLGLADLIDGSGKTRTETGRQR
jgi:aldehyde:ferredoxin oxidoreductase